MEHTVRKCGKTTMYKNKALVNNTKNQINFGISSYNLLTSCVI